MAVIHKYSTCIIETTVTSLYLYISLWVSIIFLSLSVAHHPRHGRGCRLQSVFMRVLERMVSFCYQSDLGCSVG